jgi:hypothetical protein
VLLVAGSRPRLGPTPGAPKRENLDGSPALAVRSVIRRLVCKSSLAVTLTRRLAELGVGDPHMQLIVSFTWSFPSFVARPRHSVCSSRDAETQGGKSDDDAQPQVPAVQDSPRFPTRRPFGGFVDDAVEHGTSRFPPLPISRRAMTRLSRGCQGPRLFPATSIGPCPGPRFRVSRNQPTALCASA